MSAFIQQQQEQRSLNNQLVNSRERNDTILSKPIMKSTFKKPFENGFTCDSGKLIPVLIQQVYPGDIYEIEPKSLIRLSATSSQPYSNINYDINYFFVPYSQIDKEFKYAMGENDKKGAIASFIPFPKLLFGATNISTLKYDEHDLAGYCGIPIHVDLATSLPHCWIYDFLAYGHIWNEWYRDENLQDSIDITSYYDNEYRAIATNPTTEQLKDFYTSIIYGKGLAPVSKLPNYYFTTLPYKQKGTPLQILDIKDVTLKPLSVVNDSTKKELFDPMVYNAAGNVYKTAAMLGTGTTPGMLLYSKGSEQFKEKAYMSLHTQEQDNVFANIEPIDINHLRDLIVAQHKLETWALMGSRYVEQLASIWGISINPLEIERPELLGGINDNLIFNTVQQTSETTATQQLGKLASNLYNSVNCPKIKYAASQHGLIVGVLSLRTTINNGGQGIPKRFLYKDSFDLFDPQYNGIGEQPIYNFEIYLKEGALEKNLEVFGYNEPFLDTKYNIDTAAGFMSLNSKTSLFTNFLYGEKYNDTPELSDDFIRYPSNVIGNTLYQVHDTNKEFYQQFACYIYHDITYTTSQPLYDNPGVNYI